MELSDIVELCNCILKLEENNGVSLHVQPYFFTVNMS